MQIKYLPAEQRPDGYRYYQDVVREIEAEGFKCTGWHYRSEPSADEIAYKARVHCRVPVEMLVSREIVSDEGRPGWTLFVRVDATCCC